MKFTTLKIIGIFVLSLLLLSSFGCKKETRLTTTEGLSEQNQVQAERIDQLKQENEDLKIQHKNEMENMLTAQAKKHNLEMQGMQDQLNEANKKLNEEREKNSILEDEKNLLKTEIDIKTEDPTIWSTKIFRERMLFLFLIVILVIVIFFLAYRYNRQSDILRRKAEYIIENAHDDKELNNGNE